MTGYSVAIRTLGSNPEVLHKELESIARQSVAPDKVGNIPFSLALAKPQS